MGRSQLVVVVGSVCVLGLGLLIKHLSWGSADAPRAAAPQVGSPAGDGDGGAGLGGVVRTDGRASRNSDSAGLPMRPSAPAGAGKPTSFHDQGPAPSGGVARSGGVRAGSFSVDSPASPQVADSTAPVGDASSRLAAPGNSNTQAARMERPLSDKQVTSSQPREKVMPAPAQNQAPLVDPNLIYKSDADTQFPTEGRVQVSETGDQTLEAGTLSFTVQPEFAGWESQQDASLLEIGNQLLQVRKNVNYLRIEMTDSTGADNGTGINVADWEPGDPHQITATWGGGMLSLYIDGKLAVQREYATPFEIPSGTPVFAGSDPTGTKVAAGVLSNIQVSRKQLAPNEIADQFASASPPAK